jgi:hypothetical protein
LAIDKGFQILGDNFSLVVACLRIKKANIPQVSGPTVSKVEARKYPSRIPGRKPAATGLTSCASGSR